MLANYLKQLSRWVLPYSCLGCGLDCEYDLDLCVCCNKNLPWLKNRCYRCALILNENIEAIICETCRSNPPPFDRLCALFAYEPPITTFVTQLKFSKKIAIGILFADLLAEATTKNWYKKQQLPELIIPVPLHPKRQRHRGYNQTLEFCQPLAKKLRIPLGQDLCTRVKYTQQQSRLNKSLRSANLNEAFIITESFNYRHIVIVDDVVTTGSTVRAMCRQLRSAGAETIDIWCIARA